MNQKMVYLYFQKECKFSILQIGVPHHYGFS